MLAAYEADADLGAMRFDFSDTPRQVLAVLIAGLMARFFPVNASSMFMEL